MEERKLWYSGLRTKSTLGEYHSVSTTLDDKWLIHGYTSYFSGFKNKDVAFFHKGSKTLIEADLLFNLPGNEQVSDASCSAQRNKQLTGITVFKVEVIGVVPPYIFTVSIFMGT